MRISYWSADVCSSDLRIARAAGRQQMLQLLARRPALNVFANACRLGQHMVDVVAEIIGPRPLAAPDMGAVRNLGDEQRGFGADMPRNAERLVIGKALAPKVARQLPRALRGHQYTIPTETKN